ncbi:MAG: VOC family protein [Actinomycetota bacterium]
MPPRRVRERRLVHHQLHNHLRHVADRIPSHVSAGRRLRKAAYEELKGRGVEFVEQPEERPYGIDAAFRDPSGNHIRLTQVREPTGM